MKNVWCCRLHRVQIQMFVCFFLLFVCYTSIRKFTKERGRTQPIVCTCTPGCIGFRFRCLCVSSPSNFSAKVLRQKVAARRHKLTLQKSNTLIWTFLSLCKELQSLCWSSGKQSCSRSGENYCDGTDHGLRQPQETHLANPFVRIYLETSICSDHILSHYISTLLAQQCIVGKFNSRCYPCWLWALVRRSSLPWKRHRGRRGCQAASRWGSVEWPESGNMSHQGHLRYHTSI